MMTERKNLAKLTALIEEVAEAKTIRRGGEWVEVVNSEEIATYLIAHGVTMKQMQEPLTFEEARTLDVGWIESRELNKIFLAVFAPSTHEALWFRSRYGQRFEWAYAHDYGQVWRCWATKPTDEERQAAEWLK